MSLRVPFAPQKNNILAFTAQTHLFWLFFFCSLVFSLLTPLSAQTYCEYSSSLYSLDVFAVSNLQPGHDYVFLAEGETFNYSTALRYFASSEYISGSHFVHAPFNLRIRRRIEQFTEPDFESPTIPYQEEFEEYLFSNELPITQTFFDSNASIFKSSGFNQHFTDFPVSGLPVGLYKFIFTATVNGPVNESICSSNPSELTLEKEFFVSVETPVWFCTTSGGIFPYLSVDRTENEEDPDYNRYNSYSPIIDNGGGITIEGQTLGYVTKILPGFPLPLKIGTEWYAATLIDTYPVYDPLYSNPQGLILTAGVKRFLTPENPTFSAMEVYLPEKEILRIDGELTTEFGYGFSEEIPYKFSGPPGKYVLEMKVSATPPDLSGDFLNTCEILPEDFIFSKKFLLNVKEKLHYRKQKNEIGNTFTIGSGLNGFTGAFSHQETDLTIPAVGFPFNWTRISNSNFVHYDSELGHSWWSPYFQRLYSLGYNSEGNSDIIYKTAEGRLEFFVYEGFVFDEELQEYVEKWTPPKDLFIELTYNIELGEFVLTGKDKVKYHFEGVFPLDIFDFTDVGRLLKIVDRFGNTIQLEYKEGPNQEILLDRIYDTYGREITFFHNNDGFIEQIIDFSGREVLYEYYNEGNQFGGKANIRYAYLPEAGAESNIQHDYSGGNRLKTEYRYDKEQTNEMLRDAITEIIDAKGQSYVKNIYSTEENVEELLYGRVLSQDYGSGQFNFYYEKEPEAIPEGAAGAKLLVIENDRRGMVKEVYANERGNALLTQNYTGFANKTQQTTRTSNRPIVKVRPNDPNFFETKAEYNAEGLVTKITSPEGNVTTYAYSGTEVRHGKNNVIRVGVQNRENPSDELVTTLSYESNFQLLKSITDPKGNVTTNVYDYETEGGSAIGVVVEIIHPTVTEGIAANGGNQESSETFQYNQFGQLTQQTDAEGKVVDYVYYPHLNGSATGGYLKEVIVDPAGLALKTIYTYDAVGNIVKRTDPNGRDFIFVVNELNQVVKTETPALTAFPEDAGASYETITWYDKNGNVEKVWNELKNSFNDADANVPGFESPTHYETQFMYDILDNVKQVKKEAVNHPDMQAYLLQIYEYDENENVTKIRYNTGSDAEKERFVYDERNLTFKHIVGAGEAGASTTRYNYTPNGKIQKVISSNSANTVTYEYDGFDRLKEAKNAIHTRIIYDYDENSNLIETLIRGEQSENGAVIGISPKRAFFDQNSIDTFESISLQMLSFSQRKNLYSAHLIESTKKRKNLKLISCRIR